MGLSQLTGQRLSAQLPVLVAALFVFLAACGPDLRLHTQTTTRDVRPDDPSANEPRYQPGIVLDVYDSLGGAFRVHFTRDGPDRVPGAQASIPEYVRMVADTYDEAITHYRQLGFRQPLRDGEILTGNGGDTRIDVYLVDFFGRGDGSFVVDDCTERQCIGHIRHENDFSGYGYPNLRTAHRILASHELFHAVQAAYRGFEVGSLQEGTAVWATESFDPSLDDLEGFIGAYLSDTARSLDAEGGGFDSFVYGVGLFFQYLSERFEDELIRELWEERAKTSAPESWITSLDTLLQTRGGRFGDEFERFCRWNLSIGSSGEETYANASRYPGLSPPTEAAPYDSGRLRLFPASMIVRAVDIGDRNSVSIQLADTSTDVTQGLRLVTGWRTQADAGLMDLASHDPASPVLLSSQPSSGQLWVALINTEQMGRSRRPRICVGTQSEVDWCRKVAEPEQPEEETPKDKASFIEEDGGCRSTEPTGTLLTCIWILLLMLRLYSIRRRGQGDVLT